MKFTWILILNSLVISLPSCKPEEIILHGEISGLVTDAETSQPLDVATVVLNPLNEMTRTGNDGKYLFKSLTPGNYEIQASKQNYAEGTKTAVVTSAYTTDINLALNAIPVIHYSDSILDFGFYFTSLSFTISKTGFGKSTYMISPSKDWITINPSSGDVDNEIDSINVTINRTGLNQPSINEWIIIRSTYLQYDFQDTINVNVKVHNPIIFNPNLSYGTVADIEGNVYKTIQIGVQVWMAENLRTTRYKDNMLIPHVKNDAAWRNLTTPGYCWYNNDETLYKDTYGALYNWYTVKTSKLCPQGWHVPTDLEWHELILYLDPNSLLISGAESEIVGDKIKETGSTHWSTGTGVTNSSGFTGLPSNYRNSTGPFPLIGEEGDWWSATETNEINAILRFVGDDSIFWRYCCFGKSGGMSVRCIKDQ